jgi:undecaprenyl-diphosphatase
MDYALEQLINGPAGSRPVLDVVMTIVASGAEVIFLALVAGWFLVGMLRHQSGDRYGAIAAVVAAAAAMGFNQVIALVWARPRPFVAHPAADVLLSRSADPHLRPIRFCFARGWGGANPASGNRHPADVDSTR